MNKTEQIAALETLRDEWLEDIANWMMTQIGGAEWEKEYYTDVFIDGLKSWVSMKLSETEHTGTEQENDNSSPGNWMADE